MKKYIFIVSGIVLVAIGYLVWGRNPKANYDFIIVKKQDVIQQVSVTGKVEPAQSVDLAFEKGGKVSVINIGVGDKVYAGQALIILENAELSAQLLQAGADLKNQQAKLEELRQGTRPEEIRIQEAKVESAKISVENDKNVLVNKIEDSYTKFEDAVRGKIDQFFDNPRTSDPQINIQVADGQLKQDVNRGRFLIEEILISWDSFPDESKKNLEQARSFLEKIALAVNGLVPTPSLSLTTINTYKSDVSTARTNVNPAITNLVTTEKTLRDSESALILTQKQLDLEMAGSTPEQILAQEAQVESAQANVKNYQAQISKTIIRSPINGTITGQDAKVGEIISANVSLVSIISVGNFEIEANIPESDIAKVKIGDNAQVTLDAYGQDVVFHVKVSKIDPAETVIEGVPTYKVTLYFNEKDDRLKSGMTANVDIFTAEVKNAIAIPQRAILSDNGKKTVKIIEGKDIKEIEVKIGLKGTDGNAEILQGLNEGDKVITFVKEK